jgi:pimeloyl-ACP methyl ester carboxylesterase
MIYVPPHFSANYVDAAARRAHLERWRDASGQAVGLRRLSPTQPAAGRLLVVYGNGGWTVDCRHYADDFQGVASFDVYILEYPGYADRAGAPSQSSLFRAAAEGLGLLGTNQPVYVLGESLGTGVAAYLAGTYPDRVAGLILLSPYNRLTGVAQERMPFLPVWLLLLDRFPSDDYLSHYHGPVGITVDGRDPIVPERFGLQLYNGYTGPKRLWRFPDSYHITIGEPVGQFWTEVLAFWQANQPVAKYK